MKIVLAPDSFKECLPAHRICAALAAGVRQAVPAAEVVEVPMADGGQGTVEALIRATGGQWMSACVTGPLGEPVNARYGLINDGTVAVLEMAAASGLELVPREKRNPLVATTRGTGELIRAALDEGVKRILLGIGGSATNDGGAGMAQALGFRLLDENGHELPPGGGGLDRLARIDASERDPRLDRVVFEVACDVTNPLTGPHGASAIYGPQKGATPDMVRVLDQNLAHLAAIVRRDLGVDMETPPGAGAAGGLGGGLLAFCRAQLRRGVELVMTTVQLREKLAGAALCLTGEGSIDRSSPFGKTAFGVAQLCRELGVPAVALAGSIRAGAEGVLAEGPVAYFSVLPGPATLEEALASAESNLCRTAAQVVRLFVAGCGAR